MQKSAAKTTKLTYKFANVVDCHISYVPLHHDFGSSLNALANKLLHKTTHKIHSHAKEQFDTSQCSQSRVETH